MIHAPRDVEVDIPLKSTKIGSFTILSQGIGGGGSSDGSTITSRSFLLEPDGFGLQKNPVFKIPYIDKRAHSTGEHKVLHTEQINFVINPWY